VDGNPTEMQGGLTCDTITTTGIIMAEDVNVKETLTAVQTQVDALINFTEGGVNFRAYNSSSGYSSINAGNKLSYNNID